jgi:hypothetical protein
MISAAIVLLLLASGICQARAMESQPAGESPPARLDTDELFQLFGDLESGHAQPEVPAGRVVHNLRDPGHKELAAKILRILPRSERAARAAAVPGQLERRTAWQDGDMLRINWMAHKEPIEFDAVEVLNAGDDEMDAFVKYARFGMMEQVQRRLRKMRCVIGAQCRFARPETTRMNLEHTFGPVTVA